MIEKETERKMVLRHVTSVDKWREGRKRKIECAKRDIDRKREGESLSNGTYHLGLRGFL